MSKPLCVASASPPTADCLGRNVQATLRSVGVPADSRLLGQECPSHCSVGVPADELRLDKNVQATLTGAIPFVALHLHCLSTVTPKLRGRHVA